MYLYRTRFLDRSKDPKPRETGALLFTAILSVYRLSDCSLS